MASGNGRPSSLPAPRGVSEEAANLTTGMKIFGIKIL